MRRTAMKLTAVFVVLILMMSMAFPAALAGETDDAVAAVIAQLEQIDTLQQIQDENNSYTVKNNHYDVNTTSTTIINEHNNARTGYETYLSEMLSARAAAKMAYDALTDEQKAQIDPALVAKLNDKLENTLRIETYPVTPRDDEYAFELVAGPTGYGYEVSNYMVSAKIPQTFVLVDTSDGKTSWTPSGVYEYGESNFEVTYCCDIMNGLVYPSDYKRVNLEDSSYYGPNAAKHIRAILLNSYPFISVEEMKARLKAGGLNAELVDSLDRAEMMAGTQGAIWAYANAADGAAGGTAYFASVDVTKNIGKYFTPMHDYSNEIWEWLPGKGQRTYDPRAEYRVNNLIYYLCNLEGVEAEKDEVVITNVEITRADLVAGSEGDYQVGLYVHVEGASDKTDDLTVSVVSYQANEDGTVATVTGRNAQKVGGREKISMTVDAHAGDTITVVVEGTQTLSKGVYFYEAEEGRKDHQCLIGIGEGETNVRAEKTFTFAPTIDEYGIRIYKTEKDTGMPLEGIVFNVYKVVPDEGESLGEVPTEEAIAKYQTEENLAGSITTDATGYGELALEEGFYLVIEEHNEEKIKSPVEPFYISVPMAEQIANDDGSTTTKTYNIVSVYPKNETVPPPEPPVVPPSPDTVKGRFEILKYDAGDPSVVLEGAVFEVYRALAEKTEGAQIVECGGVQYAVEPVIVDGAALILTTGADGRISSPELTCGVYILKEVKAPAGYNLRDEPISVTVVANTVSSSAALVEVSNQRGDILPETGGAGVMWFYAIGGALMLSAVILLIVRRRMSMCK